MIYLDNAATTFPKPTCVHRAVQQAMIYYGANPGRAGHDLSLKTAEMVYRTRCKAAKLFDCEAEQVVFTKNCTEAINTAIKGILNPGDHIIISDLEHNAVYRVAEGLKRKGVIDYDIAPTFDNDEQTVWHFEHLIRPNTVLIACTQGSNVFGNRLPVEKIGRAAHRRGVLMLADAAQTAGLLRLSMRKNEIDFLCMPGHKGLYGPTGTGMLILNSSVLPGPLCDGGTGSLSMEPTMPDFLPDRLESGTLNTAGIIGLGAGIDFVCQNTPERLYEHEMRLCRDLYARLSGYPQIRLYSEEPKLGKNLPLISFNIKGVPSETTAELLNRCGIAVRAGFHCAALAHQRMRTDKSGTVRISLGAFNTQNEMAACERAVRKILTNVK